MRAVRSRTASRSGDFSRKDHDLNLNCSIQVDNRSFTVLPLLFVSISRRTLNTGDGTSYKAIADYISPMEAFHLLSRGGAKFDKQKFKSDVQRFDVCI